MNEFIQAIRKTGLNPPNYINPGKWMRFPGLNKGKKNSAAWCYLFPDRKGGVFGDWSTGLKETWRSDEVKHYNAQELADFEAIIKNAQEKARKDQEKKQKEISEKVTEEFNRLPEASEHEYLKNKGVKSHGLRMKNNHLVIPLYSHDGTITTYQTINSNGSKRFYSGGIKKGSSFSIHGNTDTVFICEGYATGASIHEVTGNMVLVACDAGNIVNVAQVANYKNVIVASDNDEAGIEAAKKTGLKYILPPVNGDDWNDYCQRVGHNKTKITILELINSPQSLPSKNTQKKGSVHLIRGDELIPEKIHWLWPGWLAKSKLHILAGNPGTGKTTVALSLAAIVSSGGSMPDKTKVEKGNVLIWSGEDSIEDTLLPRLIASGGDIQNIYFVRGVKGSNEETIAFDPSQHLPQLQEKAEEVGNVTLLIVDPLVNIVTTKDHSNASTRRDLQPLVDLTEKLKIATIGIHHLSKGTVGTTPTDRITGSIAYSAVARLIMVAVKIKGDDTKRLFVRVKSNIGPDGDGFHYSFKQDALKDYKEVIASSIEWGDFIEGESEKLLSNAESKQNKDSENSQDETCSWLEEIMKESKEGVDKKEIMEAGKSAGFSERTIQRARETLGIKYHSKGFGKEKRSIWYIPLLETLCPENNESLPVEARN